MSEEKLISNAEEAAFGRAKLRGRQDQKKLSKISAIWG